MRTFATPQQAKQYLIDQITTEADREATPLTEVERRILYYTESGETLPDIEEINEAFDRDYNQPEYENKIASLARKALRHDPAAWERAVNALKTEDHYLLLLINQRNRPAQSRSGDQRPFQDTLKLIVTALAICLAVLATIFYFASHQPTP